MAPVKLYIYDLSNGMARAMSRQLTGSQIDGIWHTSVVAFGKEIYYGQGGNGIDICLPGRSHHGNPLEVFDLGQTEIDEGTFWEYIDELRGHYRADKYHLLEFNCNNFTNDIAGFLTGGSIPPHIKDLPAHFLSTPFGQQMRPMIDNMFRRPGAPGAGAYPPPTTNGVMPQLGNALLQNVASQVGSSDEHVNGNGYTNGNNGPAAAFPSEPPHPHTTGSGKKLHAIMAISLHPILYTQVPSSIDVPVSKLVASLDATINKVSLGKTSNIETNINLEMEKLMQAKTALTTSFAPYLKKRFPPGSTTPSSALPPPASLRAPSQKDISSWITMTQNILSPLNSSSSSSFPSPDPGLTSLSLAPSEIFPLVDLWRLAVLDTALTPGKRREVVSIIEQCVAQLSSSSPSSESSNKAITAVPRPLLLTVLRLASNAFTIPSSLSPSLVPDDNVSQSRDKMTLLVLGLLHTDAAVRTAAASLAFNVSSARHAPLRQGQGQGGDGYSREVRRRREVRNMSEGDGDVELACALLEALEREVQNEEVVHRLVSALALLLYFSPSLISSEGSESELGGTLEVLGARDKLLAKLAPGGCGLKGVLKPDLRKLVEEVASLCP